MGSDRNEDTDRQLKFLNFSIKSMVSSSHQNRKRSSVEDDVSSKSKKRALVKDDALKEGIFSSMRNITGEAQARQNSGGGIMNNIAIGIKMFGIQNSKNIQRTSIPENFEYAKCLYSMMIF